MANVKPLDQTEKGGGRLRTFLFSNHLDSDAVGVLSLFFVKNRSLYHYASETLTH